MKKFIFTANVIAIMALVPAIVFGYLNSNHDSKENKPNTEVAKDVTNGQDDGATIHIVRTF